MNHSNRPLLLGLVFSLTAGYAAAQATKPTESQIQDAQKQYEQMQEDARKNATWHIGDPAPPLKVHWLKGKASDNFNDGKVHVVEFWATWCGPCRQNMPHLSDLARKYKGQVELASISIWERAETKDKNAPYEERVIDLVKHSGDMMDYPVGMDSDDFMADHWMKASGSLGIPMAFIIDKHGKYAWSAPAFEGLDQAIQLALDDKLDAVSSAKVHDDYLAAMKLRRSYMRDAAKALQDKKPDEAIQLSDEAAGAVPMFASETWPTLFYAHVMRSQEEGNAFFEETLKKHDNDPLALRSFATDIQNEYPALALRALQTAMRCSSPTEPGVALRLAAAYAENGDYKHAAEVQENGIEGLRRAAIDSYKPMIEPQEKILEEYRQKAKDQTGQEKSQR